MKVSRELAAAAFREHYRKYASPDRSRPWELKNHARYWRVARNAFAGGSDEAFVDLYDELKGNWQALRGKGQQKWTAQRILQAMRELPTTFAKLRLRDFEMKHLMGLWELLLSMRDLKRSKEGPSIVAISKFLHFWNPRLFVIVDRGVIWNYVFGHDWIWLPIKRIRDELQQEFPDLKCDWMSGACDLLSYLAVLAWASKLVRENPILCSEMAAYLQAHTAGSQIPDDADEYDAATVEWFLVGVVEVMPPGAEV